jgi:hypothetical protein
MGLFFLKAPSMEALPKTEKGWKKKPEVIHSLVGRDTGLQSATFGGYKSGQPPVLGERKTYPHIHRP